MCRFFSEAADNQPLQAMGQTLNYCAVRDYQRGRRRLSYNGLTVSKDEIDRLRLLLRAMVEASGRTHRDIEGALGLGHGYLSHLFAGRLELKFKHVFQLGDELGFSPGEFFQLAYSPAPRERPWLREDLGGVFARMGAELRAPEPGPPAGLDTLKDLIREAVAEALLRESHRERSADRSERETEEKPPERARRAS
jgi:hypothetical protein